MGDTVIILPFENTSNRPEFNWVGESFALSLSDLLRVPGLNVVSNSERKIIQQRLRIPLTSIPSLATSLRLARESGATLLISGRYNIVPAQDDVAATINITARIIRVIEGRFLSEELPDGRRITRDIALNDALGNLQTIQGQIAYQILYQRDKALPFSQNALIESANKVPARAFEAYIKGLLTQTPEIRENYFKNAIKLYADSGSDGAFADAALELGHLYLGQRKYAESIDSFERVVNTNQICREKAKGENKISQCNDESFAEASFYIGVIRWQQANYEQALGVLRPLADDLKITSVYNMLGAIAVEASRAEKKDQARAAALLTEGVDLLKKAAESAPDDSGIRFNYGIALYLHNDHLRAAEQLRAVISANARDGEAYYVLSKSLAELKDPTAAGVDNQARLMLTSGNRYAMLEREWGRTKGISEINLRVEQPQRRDFVSVVLSQRSSEQPQAPLNATEALLVQARTLYKNANDDEAMAVIRRILVSEPMSAESYLILGKIHLRRGDRDQAASAFKTALFWDNRLIDGHVSLGKIYLERGDCQQARTYAAAALEIDKENQDANGLQRQAARCSK
ncbi:MAG TPA: tetratricopeptide repeat protein [Pyrinomonadaceae bacterium]|nr:tetratricopeptide repeat protein [Chloracidobacterium sp.]HRJ88107.1 tetratricopeptide repeat protein [Pyrinomonadaceae bacterium]HRK51803.1 tetratricopeptide repeat protein [Pyrinomonadaceae bacterium]